VVNIPPDVDRACARRRQPEGAKAPARRLQTAPTTARPATAPLPPPGDHPHRYLFTVFAVGADSLQVTTDTSAAVIGFQLHFKTLAKVAIMGLYKRS